MKYSIPAARSLFLGLFAQVGNDLDMETVVNEFNVMFDVDEPADKTKLSGIRQQCNIAAKKIRDAFFANVSPEKLILVDKKLHGKDEERETDETKIVGLKKIWDKYVSLPLEIPPLKRGRRTGDGGVSLDSDEQELLDSLV